LKWQQGAIAAVGVEATSKEEEQRAKRRRR
jgi:hypothetical protein